jgi:hypothetical protein
MSALQKSASSRCSVVHITAPSEASVYLIPLGSSLLEPEQHHVNLKSQLSKASSRRNSVFNMEFPANSRHRIVENI